MRPRSQTRATKKTRARTLKNLIKESDEREDAEEGEVEQGDAEEDQEEGAEPEAAAS